MVLVLIVRVTIDPAREAEFIDVMEADAVGSRMEAGCQRFDVSRVSSEPCTWIFYEIYDDDDAKRVHTEQVHFQPWVAFKKSGGVLDIDVTKCGGLAERPALITPR